MGARSLSAKIGFFFCPDKLVPYDTLAHQGLNELRGRRSTGGEGRLDPKTYAEYLNAFNDKFEAYRRLLARELDQRWVTTLARKYGCEARWLKTRRFQRKTFDSFLVHIGRRLRDERQNNI